MGDPSLLMIGAMYENGGNTTHRCLDGHPELFVYPFESQLGTRLVQDHLSATYPVKYRWPVFPLDGTPAGDYQLIIDEEGKVRSRTPDVSKFRHHPFEMSDDERRDRYIAEIQGVGRSRPNNVRAFFRATFDAWRDFNRTGRERIYVGYSPILVVDALKILEEMPDVHFLHVVRNPWSAYADTRKRPVPLPLSTYLLGWTMNQYFALLAARAQPERMHIVRAEDIMEDSKVALTPLCESLGIEVGESLAAPSWNGQELDEVYPWGTIRRADPAANLDTAQELSTEETEAVREHAWQYLGVFGYSDFLTEGPAPLPAQPSA